MLNKFTTMGDGAYQMPEIIKPYNRLLAALPSREYKRLLPKLEEVPLTFGNVIYEPGNVIHHVYFPKSGVLSLFTRLEKEEMVEAGLVGSEGIAGLPVFLGEKTSSTLVIVQGSGTALRMKTEDFLRECGRGPSLQKLLYQFTNFLLKNLSQLVACTRFHRIDDRLVCLLLMMHERIQADKFLMTQEILSKMMGVRREAVGRYATKLQQNGLINYSRGTISILNREGLESSACQCYSILNKEYNKLLDATKL